jgi:hypothetical protein
MGVGMGQYEKSQKGQAKPSQSWLQIHSFIPSFLSSIKMLLLSCRMICTAAADDGFELFFVST